MNALEDNSTRRGGGGIGNWREDRYNSAFAIKTILRINSCLHNSAWQLSQAFLSSYGKTKIHTSWKNRLSVGYTCSWCTRSKKYTNDWAESLIKKKRMHHDKEWYYHDFYMYERSNLIMPHRENVIDKLYSIRGLDACIQVLVQHVFVCM